MTGLSTFIHAKRLRIYIDDTDHWRGDALYSTILETLRKLGAAGATIFRGNAGFGAHSRVHTSSIEVLMGDLPVVIETVDTPQKIAALLEVVSPMVREGLITVDDVEIVKYTHRYLNPLPSDRLVSEVMTREVIRLSPEMPLQQAWKLMFEKVMKALPVVDSSGKVLGILTDEDLFERGGIRQRLSVAIRLDAGEISREINGLRTSPLRVKDVMTQPVITALETESLGLAVTRMVKAGLKRLPVVNDSGNLVGILSRLDILRQVANSHHLQSPVRTLPGAMSTLKDVMTTDIPLISQEDGLSAIIGKFSQSDSHRLIVVDSAGKAIGLISDSDVVARVQPAKRRSILDAFRRNGKPVSGKETALDLMSPDPLMADPDLPVVEAIRKMLQEARKWLVIVDENRKPLGLVDRQILLESVAVDYKSE